MAAVYKSKQILKFVCFSAAASITFLAAIVALLMNAITSPPAMVLGTLVSDKSLLSIPLTVLGGAVPGIITAYIIFIVFTLTRLKSFKLSLFAIAPIMLFWVCYILFVSTLSVGKLIGTVNIISQIVALFFIYKRTITRKLDTD